MMRRLLKVAALLALATPESFAKKPKRPEYNLTAKVVFHSVSMYSKIKDRDDLFYDGDYICTPGDDHNAPTCHTETDWVLMRTDRQTLVTLEDGRSFILGDFLCTATFPASSPPINPCPSTVETDLRKVLHYVDRGIHADGDTEVLPYRLKTDEHGAITMESQFGSVHFGGQP